jgi:hypothetical protein
MLAELMQVHSLIQPRLGISKRHRSFPAPELSQIEAHRGLLKAWGACLDESFRNRRPM